MIAEVSSNKHALFLAVKPTGKLENSCRPAHYFYGATVPLKWN